MEAIVIVNIFHASALNHHQMNKDKAVCALWIYFNAVRRLDYGHLLKKYFEVKDFGVERVLRHNLIQEPKRLCFLAGLMKHLNVLSLKPQGKGRPFVFRSEDLRLKPGI